MPEMTLGSPLHDTLVIIAAGKTQPLVAAAIAPGSSIVVILKFEMKKKMITAFLLDLMMN